MSAQKILALIVSAYLWLGYVAVPAHCEDVRAQQNQAFSEALKTAIGIEPLPKEIIDLALYLGNARPVQYEALKQLFEYLRESAAHVQSPQDYSIANSAAILVLRALDNADSKTALDLFKSWPARPGFADEYKDFNKQFEAAKQRNRLAHHPMDYLDEHIPVDNTNAWITVIWELQSSRPEDARYAFERLLSEGEEQQGSSSSSPLTVGRILNPNLWTASLFGRYFNLLKRNGLGAKYELSCDNEPTTLDYAEGEALQVILRVFQNHPDIATELLQAAPGLKGKVVRVGGLQAIWEHGQLRGKSPYVGSPVFYEGHKDLNSRLDTLCNQFENNLHEGRQSLESLKSAKNFDFLSRAASAPCPAVSEMASSFAREMALNEPDAETRISMALQLMPRYSDGTPQQSKWIEFGFNVLRGANPRISSSNRSGFENRLIGQVAVIDFGRAMSYIHATEEPLDRMQMLISVVEALDRESMRAKQ